MEKINVKITEINENAKEEKIMENRYAVVELKDIILVYDTVVLNGLINPLDKDNPAIIHKFKSEEELDSWLATVSSNEWFYEELDELKEEFCYTLIAIERDGNDVVKVRNVSVGMAYKSVLFNQFIPEEEAKKKEAEENGYEVEYKVLKIGEDFEL